MGLRAPRKKFEKCFPKEIPRYFSRGECTKSCSKRTDPGRCVSKRSCNKEFGERGSKVLT